MKDADIILTDGWTVKKENHEEYDRFLPYQINMNKIKIANNDCLLNPCPPFTGGNEINEEVIKSNHFIGYSAKESLLHMQKAILATLKKE